MSGPTESPQILDLKSIAKTLAEDFNFKDSIPTLRHPRSKRSYNIKKEIVNYLPREAIACYRAACTDPAERNCSLIEQRLYHEPFTYWDWYGLTQEEWEVESGTNKRRLIWEHRKGTKVAYPSGKWRWHAVKSDLDENPERKKYVKRIAVSRWMTEEDLAWIVEELTELEGLCLSDIGSDGELRWDRLSVMIQGTSILSVNSTVHSSLHVALKKLKWLGISDWKSMPHGTPVPLFIAACTSLLTLSIRGAYKPDPEVYRDVHDEVCGFISELVKSISETVHTIELRLSMPFLGLLLAHLQQETPNVQRVGIDIGALSQVFPLKDCDSCGYDRAAAELEHNAFTAATEARKQMYIKARQSIPHSVSKEDLFPSKVLFDPSGKRVELPEVRYSESTEFYKKRSRPKTPFPAKKPTGQIHPYCELKYPSDHKQLRDTLERARADTLNDLFRQVFEASMRLKPGLTLFPLTPELQNRSTDAIAPTALIDHDLPLIHRAPKSAQNRRPSNSPDLTIIYGWIHETFSWNPVIDWNEFMGFGRHTDVDRGTLKAIKRCLQLMKNVGIPIHLLIARRELPSSSLYWGWPYQEDDFVATVAQPIDHGLGSIAGLVDTLSIFYDLRHPLDRASLVAIDKLQPYRPSSQPARRVFRIGGPQKMANKSKLKKSNVRKSYARLASTSILGGPLPGQNADEHPSDDSDLDDDTSLDYISLHRVARRAAYYREALGWQRFWAAYSLSFRSLTKLRVRMPSSFDKIGSWRLAKLLNQKVGWDMITYTDERQHMQTQQELDEQPEGKVWPAGKFVRRTWIWPEKKIAFGTDETKGELSTLETPDWGNRTFTRTDWEETKSLEDEQLDEALRTAELAARRHLEVEERLLSKSGAKKYVLPQFEKHAEYEILFRRQVDAYIAELREAIADLNQQIEDFQPGPEGPDETLEYLTLEHQLLSRAKQALATLPAPDPGVGWHISLQTNDKEGAPSPLTMPGNCGNDLANDEIDMNDLQARRAVEDQPHEFLTPLEEQARPSLPQNPVPPARTEMIPINQGNRKRSSEAAQSSPSPAKKTKVGDHEFQSTASAVQDAIPMSKPRKTLKAPIKFVLPTTPPTDLTIPSKPATEIPATVHPPTESNIPSPPAAASPIKGQRKPSLKGRKGSVARPPAPLTEVTKPPPEATEQVPDPVKLPAEPLLVPPTQPPLVPTQSAITQPPEINYTAGPIQIQIKAPSPVVGHTDSLAAETVPTASVQAEGAKTASKRGPELMIEGAAAPDAVPEPKSKRRKKTPLDPTYVDKLTATGEDDDVVLLDAVPEGEHYEKGKKSKQKAKKRDDDGKYKALKDDHDSEDNSEEDDVALKKRRCATKARGRGGGGRGAAKTKSGRKTGTPVPPTTVSAEDGNGGADAGSKKDPTKGPGKKTAAEPVTEQAEGSAAAEPEKQVKTTKPRKKAEPKQEIVSPVARRTRAGMKKKQEEAGKK